MNARLSPSPLLHYAYALIAATVIVVVIGARTNAMPPQWDAHYYIDMARFGIIDNPNLAAPFAYRPGMPFLSGTLANALSIPIEEAFRIVGRICAVLFLLSVFLLSRAFTSDYRQALAVMVLAGFSYTHVKIPLFFYTLVDVAAYPLMVVASWALLTGRHRLCVFVSAVGLLFKEFMAVPLFALLVQLAWTGWKTRSTADGARLAVVFAIGACAILLPRLLIPVGKTFQSVDPMNEVATLGVLISAPLDEFRVLNIVYSMIGYWLPTAVLMTRNRFDQLWRDLEESGALWPCMILMALVSLLSLYGGTNIPIFVSYSVAVQVTVLSHLYRRGIGVVETVYAITATMVYNKIFLHIPLPAAGFEAYSDFYGGWASRVSLTTFVRLFECGTFIAIATLIRIVLARHRK